MYGAFKIRLKRRVEKISETRALQVVRQSFVVLLELCELQPVGSAERNHSKCFEY